MAIEYKAPHKLSRDEIVTGLASDVQPGRDVINKDCEGFSVESANRGRLQNEESICNQLFAIQGRHVPVCLGLIDLVLPYYCDGRVSEHFLLLSWAGQPLSKYVDRVDKVVAVDAVTMAYTELHQLGVFHHDAEVRNVLYDRNVIVVDFGSAEVRGRQPLGPLSTNGQNWKKKQGELMTQKRLEKVGLPLYPTKPAYQGQPGSL